jgi:hypothetical protein
MTSLARDVGARVLIVDTLAKLAGIQGEDENKAGAMLEALEVLQLALSKGITVIIIRHDRKRGGTVVDAGRGSNAIAGDADMIFQLTKPGGAGANVRRLQYEGRLEATPSEIFIELTPDGYRQVGAPGQVARDEERDRILDVLPTSRDEAIPADAIANRLGQPERTISRRLAEMRQEEETSAPGRLAWVERRAGTRGRPTVAYYRPPTPAIIME